MFWDVFKKYIIALTITLACILPAGAADFSAYMEDVQERIMNSWNPPEDIIEGHADVIFRINRNGEILSSEIIQSSGNSDFDNSVKEVLERCSFRELPTDCDKEYITVKYAFNLHIADSQKMKEYAELAEKYYNSDKQLALKYLNLAINEINGDSYSYFLYARRCKLNKELGYTEAANADLAEFNRLKAMYGQKRIRACKRMVQEENTPYSYFTLASAYDSAGEYNNAINAINQAIAMTPLNHAYIRYRAEMVMRHDRQATN